MLPVTQRVEFVGPGGSEGVLSRDLASEAVDSPDYALKFDELKWRHGGDIPCVTREVSAVFKAFFTRCSSLKDLELQVPSEAEHALVVGPDPLGAMINSCSTEWSRVGPAADSASPLDDMDVDPG